MRSAIYEGRVWHRRDVPRPHAFGYRVYFLHLDLNELPALARERRFFSVERFNLASFHRADYLGDPSRPLREAVIDRVEEELGRRPGGAVFLVIQVRTLGYVFNPVSFYFCRDAAGKLDAVVAEITNTPWNERHAYVRDAAGRDAAELRWRFDKDFHVSPFFDLDQVYEWGFTDVDERLRIDMTNYENGQPVFRAGFHGERRALTGTRLARCLLRHPLQPLLAHAAIYWQAARLYLKRMPFFTHPKKRAPLQDATTS